ncbi:MULTISPECIES: hypothetical protein [Microbacterium]|uniref:Uncharacterized protein n=1 Tax=Microbacterium schleiferi TaxID=69362 RepID=A0ABU7V3Z0_9MICO|nr:hypothetical protein [Microbacterium sp. 67-17]MBD3752382.1 hypothetical protein [Micrococcales bacterium]
MSTQNGSDARVATAHGLRDTPPAASVARRVGQELRRCDKTAPARRAPEDEHEPTRMPKAAAA